MKVKILAVAACAAAGFTNMASADATIDITGSTAFRGVAVNAIYAAFSSAPLIGSTGGATAGSFNGASAHIFKGTFPGIAGTTWIRTSWSGSTEGANIVSKDITEANKYIAIADANVSAGTTDSGGTSGRSLNAGGTPEMYFSDVSVANTNTTFVTPSGVFEDQLGSSTVGAVVFSFVKNGTSATYTNLKNITTQQFRSLFSNINSGRSLLSQFTGLDSDDAFFVYATGRNDLSGTRTVALLETGYGVANIVNQWKLFADATQPIVRTAQLWPTNDGDNRSLQWIGDIAAGNGGFNSGGTLVGFMGDTSDSIQLKDNTGGVIDNNVPAAFVTLLGQTDAATARNNGAVPLTYNGVGIDPQGAGLSAADKAKVQNGLYTLWSFEKFVPSNEINDAPFAAQKTVYTTLLSALQGASSVAAGLTVTEMANVSRATDGDTVIVSP